MSPERRAAIFRLAWDFVESTLGARGDLFTSATTSARRNATASWRRKIYSEDNRERGAELLRGALA